MTQTPPKAMDNAGIALVVFSGEADLKWLKILKPGFRHCFATLEDGPRWIIYNPLSHKTEITVVETDDVFRLMRFYRKREFRVVPWLVESALPKPAPWGPYTCVEAIKRVLGIHASRVLIPWNLYNFPKNEKKYFFLDIAIFSDYFQTIERHTCVQSPLHRPHWVPRRGFSCFFLNPDKDKET